MARNSLSPFPPPPPPPSSTTTTATPTHPRPLPLPRTAQGSLLALATDEDGFRLTDGDEVLWAVVVERPLDVRKAGAIVVKFQGGAIVDDRVLGANRLCMVESPVYYEAYKQLRIAPPPLERGVRGVGGVGSGVGGWCSGWCSGWWGWCGRCCTTPQLRGRPLLLKAVAVCCPAAASIGWCVTIRMRRGIAYGVWAAALCAHCNSSGTT